MIPTEIHELACEFAKKYTILTFHDVFPFCFAAEEQYLAPVAGRGGGRGRRGGRAAVMMLQEQ